MRNWLKWSSAGLVVFLVVAQAIRPARTNPTIDSKNEIAASVNVPPDVASILTRSCSDCHSNRTVWPWYSGVAPFSWLVVYDVREGRSKLNFSDWGAWSPEKNRRMLGEICKEVTEKEMPGSIYPLMHPGSQLSDADIQAVCRWTQSAQQSAPPEASLSGK